ncbi:MAG: hypothetical protein GXY83_15180 [Rhodopirellula sp.]|nr:hypothetical protein [Rhodopirellula sp.]
MPRSFWHLMLASRRPASPASDPRLRLRFCFWCFLALVLVVFCRLVHIEVSQGAAFRREAAKPIQRRESIPAVRGRILARDGTVLAYDREVLALAVHYRYIEEPADPGWLRGVARLRLSGTDRKDPRRLAAEIERVCVERVEQSRRLAELCQVSLDQWHQRAAAVQARVERISENVNRRRQQLDPRSGPRGGRPSARSDSLLGRLTDWTNDLLEGASDLSSPDRILVAEQLDYHVIVEDVPMEVAARVESHPDDFPGVRIVQHRRRAYPAGALAAHVLGHLGAIQPEEIAQSRFADRHPEDRIGRTGLERKYDDLLHGERGVLAKEVDRSGRILRSYRETEPGVGRDLVLTLDPQLQRTAEMLLDDAIRRRAIQSPDEEPAGGAAVVIDVRNGAVLAAASAPRYDPGLFAAGSGGAIQPLLENPSHPLVDRVATMAIPPGSVFKVVTAAALLESAAVDPREPLFCRGYLTEPDRWRCAMYRREGVGHGDVALADALAWSCNVYFFQRAADMGPPALIDWAIRFGFGRASGIDLPQESDGVVPTPLSIRDLESHGWRVGDTMALAIGQGSLQATPLQVVRMIAAVANGGMLVTPHLASGLGLPELTGSQTTTDLAGEEDPIRVPPSRRIAGLKSATLEMIREGLRRVVADVDGTAHGSVWMESIAVAGKTGTAETEGGRGDHAWFAGYAPAEAPTVAFVVALEHAGNAEQSAAPIARRLVVQLDKLGCLKTR